MLEHEPVPARLEVRFPGITGVWSDDIHSLFRRRRTSNGPFLLIGRDRGLALDTPPDQEEGLAPFLHPAHAQLNQLWYFHKTKHKGEYVIVSLASGLVLDAGWSGRLRRRPELRSCTEEAHQRWLLEPAAGLGFTIESVSTGNALQVPDEAGPLSPVPPYLWTRTGETSQQFLIVTPSSGAGRRPRPRRRAAERTAVASRPVRRQADYGTAAAVAG